MENVSGYLVIDQLIGGVAAGGLRIESGLDERELKRLASHMTMKQAAVGLRIGGAKSGLDMAPDHPSRRDVLRRFMLAIRPLILECYSLGPDVNTRMSELDALADELSIPALKIAVGRNRGIPDAKFLERYRLLSSPVHGNTVNELRPGVAVATAVEVLLKTLDLPATVSLQGAGTVGSATAKLLTRAQIPIVAWADSEKCLIAPDGLDVTSLLSSTVGGLLPCTSGPSAPEAIFSVNSGCLILAATTDGMSLSDADTLAAGSIVAAANLALPEDVEDRLYSRRLPIIPDLIAGAGGSLAVEALYASAASDGESVLAHIESRMARLTQDFLQVSSQQACAPRILAREWAHRTLNQSMVEEVSQ